MPDRPFFPPHDDEPDSVQEPTPPSGWRRSRAHLRDALVRLNIRIFTASAGIYVAAGSFVGFEALAFLLGFAPLWPIAIPMLIAGIAMTGLLVDRARKRRTM